MILKEVLTIRGVGKRAGIFALLFSVLLLPMLHRHPGIDHVHGKTEGHQHQAAIHADFFPDATHRHHHDDHEQHAGDLDFSINPSHHTLSQIDFHSLHVGQSFQFSSFFKKQLIALAQDSPEFSIFPDFQRGTSLPQHAPAPQTSRFSPPSLRAPPYFA